MTFREKVIRQIGFIQKKTAPNVKYESEKHFGGYTGHVISYDVEPGEPVRAVLLLPDHITGKIPGILAIHQHAGKYHLGKSEPAGWNLLPEGCRDWKGDPVTLDPMYAYGKDLVEKGYAVIIPDMLCFEERFDTHFSGSDGRQAGRNQEIFEFVTLIQKGSSMMAKYLHDMSVAVDILAGLDCVDAARLGVIGHSMGGNCALYMTWYDERIKAGVSSCGFSTLRAVTKAKINHNTAIYIPGFAQIGDNGDIIANIAPRAFLFTAGIRDHDFPMDGVYEIKERAEEMYARLGVPERFLAYIFDGGHSFPDDAKDRAYRFIERNI